MLAVLIGLVTCHVIISLASFGVTSGDEMLFCEPTELLPRSISVSAELSITGKAFVMRNSSTWISSRSLSISSDSVVRCSLNGLST